MKTNRVLLALITATLAMLWTPIRAEDSSTPQQVFDGMRQSFQADKAKGVHARYQWETQGHVGIYDRPLEGSRQSISRAQARRNFPLKLRFDRKPHVRGRIRLHRRFSPEEIEIASEGATDVERDVERFKVRI